MIRTGVTKKKAEAKKAQTSRGPPMREFGLAVLHNELARCKADMGVIALRLIMLLAEKAHRETPTF